MAKELGVLFVHGIGDQVRGQTLLEAGDRLVQWMQGWVARGPKDTAGTVEVISTTLDSASNDDTLPPRTELRVVAPGGGAEQRWLLAESWWGASVRPPAFGKLAGWLMTVGAWTVLSHTMKRLAGRRGKWAETLRVVSFVGGFVAAIALQLVILLLASLAALPIPPLRRALARALLAITGSLGDAYVLVESGLQRSALVQRTTEALSWLSGECNRVCVIAHSQGAAIAHLALRQSMPANMAAFISYGSGLGKLDELLCAKEVGGRIQLVARCGPILMFAFFLFGYMALFEPMDEWGRGALFIVGFMALITFAFAFAACREFWSDSGKRLQALALTHGPADMNWVDIFASHDLVSNGPLSPFDEAVPGLAGYPVENTRNWFTDHTAYWNNSSEFVPAVAYVLNNAAQSALFSTSDDRALFTITEAHRRAVRWFHATRVATLVGALVLLPLYWNDLLAFGHSVRAMIAAAGGILGGLRDEVATIAKTLASLIPGYSPDVGTRLLGAIVPVTLMLAWRSAYAFVWRWWDGLTLKQVLSSRVMHRVDRLAIDVLVIAAGFLPLTLVFAYPRLEGIVISRVIAGLALVIMGPMYVYMLVRTMVAAVRSRAARAKQQRTDFLPEGEWGALGGAAAGVFFIVQFLFPAAKDAALALMLTVTVGVFDARQQIAVNTRMREITERSWRYLVMAIPSVVSVAMIAGIIVVRIQQGRLLEGVGELPFMLGSQYALMVSLTRGGIWLAARKVKRQVIAA